MQTLILTLHIIVCVLLVILVLLQAGKEGMAYAATLAGVHNHKAGYGIPRNGRSFHNAQRRRIQPGNEFLQAAFLRAGKEQHMFAVPRHLFVQEALRAQAYEDTPLPIGYGQTISQPYIVALMTQLLEVQRGMRVLEVGTGSGYQAAVLATMLCSLC